MLKAPRLFWYLLSGFFAINLLQSGLTELFNDEAYYWYYAQHPSWGYFDHPPMVAWLVSLGSLFTTSEFGIRLGSVLLSTTSVVLFWNLIDSPRKHLYVKEFFLVLWSMPLWNAFGFLALPDSPLLFSALLFLWFYKLFLKSPDRYWFPMGISLALMMYSKYHGILIPLLVIGSNWKLVTQRYAWAAVATGILLFLPHIWWLDAHEWIPVEFHLFERPNGIYRFNDYTLGYLVNLIALFGLLTPWVYLEAINTDRKDPFRRALQWVFWGIIIFFFLSSFNRRVQAQWAIAICLPGALFLINRFLLKGYRRSWITRMLWVQFVLLLYARIALAVPALSPIVFETHYNREWINELGRQAGNRPVVFENSYMRAAKFHFYSGRPSLSINNLFYRKSEYSFDPIEDRLRGSKVHYVSPYLNDADYRILYKRKDSISVRIIDSLVTYRRLQIAIDRDQKSGPGDTLRARLINPYPEDIALESLRLFTGYCNRAKQMRGTRPNGSLSAIAGVAYLKSGDSLDFEIAIAPPAGIERPSYIRLGISEFGLPPGLNSNLFKLTDEP